MIAKRFAAASGCCFLCCAAVAAAQPNHPNRKDAVEEIVVTLPHGHRRSEIVAGTTVLTDEKLDHALAPTIGETLGNQPGISSTGYAPGASRPVIRGLGGQRVRVLQSRIGTLDVSVTSPDHPVAVEPLMAERVEVIRGPGTLIYGSNAVGGVVNVEDRRIPKEIPDDNVETAVRATYGSNANEKDGAAAVIAGYENFAVSAQGYFRNTDDYHAPGFQRSAKLRALDPQENEPRGTVRNTDIDNNGGSLGGSYIWSNGYIGTSFGIRNDNYGIPDAGGGIPQAPPTGSNLGASHLQFHSRERSGTSPSMAGQQLDAATAPNPMAQNPNVRIDAQQWRVDLDGEIRADMIAFDTARLRFGYADYQHAELEDGVVDTEFGRNAWEARMEFLQVPWKDLDGVVGLQFSDSEFISVGEEAFVPPNQTFRAAVFAVEEYPIGPYSIEGGLRYEHQDSSADSIDSNLGFDGFSFSLGAKRELFDDYLIGVTFGRTERLPGPEELFSNGPHLGTFSFELGDPTLDKETAVSVEATLRKQYGVVQAGLNFFYYRFQNFIFEDRTGEMQDGLSVFQFNHGNAEFFGGEFTTSAQIFEHRLFDAFADFQLDYVRAELTDTGTPLPRIPPLRLLAGLDASNDFLHGRLEFQWVDQQNRITDFELPTDSYFRLNLGLDWHPFPDDYDVTLRLDARNLTDAKGRNHVSFLKDRVPLPGRDIRLSVTVRL